LKRRALLIVNRHARSGGLSIDAVRTRLQEGGIEVIDPDPAHEGSLTRIIDSQGDGCDLVILGGGDGTLNAAAPALVRLGKPVGVLPLGTANDFARTIGLPLDPVQAARVIVEGRPAPVDLGEVNGHLFFNVASIGFSAELAGALTAEAKKRWGVVGYAITAARMLARSRLFTAHIEHDGTVETVRTLQVSVGNGRHYGGGMTVDHTASADDGALDFYSLEVDHWWKLLKLLPSLRKGTHGRWRDVRAFRTTEIVIRTSKPRPINTDGELSGFTPAHFRIRPEALQVYRS
jgi:diacylglycerol kinase (ATP)